MGLPLEGGDPYLEGLPKDWQPEDEEMREEEPPELLAAREKLAAFTAAKHQQQHGEEQLPGVGAGVSLATVLATSMPWPNSFPWQCSIMPACSLQPDAASLLPPAVLKEIQSLVPPACADLAEVADVQALVEERQANQAALWHSSASTCIPCTGGAAMSERPSPAEDSHAEQNCISSNNNNVGGSTDAAAISPSASPASGGSVGGHAQSPAGEVPEARVTVSVRDGSSVEQPTAGSDAGSVEAGEDATAVENSTVQAEASSGVGGAFSVDEGEDCLAALD